MVNWDAVGAVAEVTASLGVMITLVYLAIQIRGEARQQHANSVHLLSAQWAEVVHMLSDDTGFVEIWERGSESLDHLSPAERRRYVVALSQIFFVANTQHYLNEQKLLPRQIYHLVEAQFEDTLSRPAVRAWWAQNREMHDTAFRAYVDSLLN